MGYEGHSGEGGGECALVLWEGHRSWWFGGVESGARDDPELPLLNVLKRLLAQPESLCGDADAHFCCCLRGFSSVYYKGLYGAADLIVSWVRFWIAWKRGVGITGRW